MTNRENYLSIARRTGYDYMPVNLMMCPSLQKKFDSYLSEHDLKLPVGESYISDLPVTSATREEFMKYYGGRNFKPGTSIDIWGVAHEPGSEAAYHMTHMYNPMADFDSVEQIESYPMPVFHDDWLKDADRTGTEIP